MGLHTDTIWEVRTGGNNENGGGFHNRIPGTSIDYSFQNAPQLDLTDLACAGAGVTTITSVVGGFTAAMVGNVIKFHAGANFLTEFFEIVTVNSGNSVVLDRTPATGIGANGHGKVGGGQINFDLIDSVVVPGNIVYVANGIYAAHPATIFTAVSTRLLPLIIEGYNGLRGTNPTGNNRPLLQMAANAISLINYMKISNIQFGGTADPIIKPAVGNHAVFIFQNCKFENLANIGASSCFMATAAPTFADRAVFIDCEFLGTLGAVSTGISGWTALSVTKIVVLGCYFHNLTTGISMGSNSPGFTELVVGFSIFAICTTGINGLGADSCRIMNCTFDSMGADGFCWGGMGSTFINNSFTNCINAGINSTAAVVMNNNFFGNGNNWLGGTLNPVDNNTFIAPQFVTPGSNYALQRTSGLIDRAFSMRLGV